MKQDATESSLVGSSEPSTEPTVLYGASLVDSRNLIPRDEVIALLPRCHWRCPRVGVKWVGRTTLYCDKHGSPYLLDAPWAEFARKEGL